ncbi:MAG TPA: V-type ATP synthase subunit A [Candidatus Lokiarchaeia archaeon]|nr:V-type ATP synthase subunit A [Candidatus Lokiarchaeia archaeon]
METTQEGVGTIIMINGPVIQVRGFENAKIRDMCQVGEFKIPGEVIRIQRDRITNEKIAVVEVFEDTSGIFLGDEAICLHYPLSMELGPGLLGMIIDGIERPLSKYFEHSGGFIKRGLQFAPLDRSREWNFTPIIREGKNVTGGDIIGTIEETSSIVHKVMIPPGISGQVQEVVEAGSYKIEDVACKVLDEKSELHDVQLFQRWPITVPRPIKKRLMPIVPLITGVRIIDTLFPITKGGCATVPGGFGTGKTVLQQQLSKFCDANVIVYVGCGERGNELADVLEQFPQLEDPATGKPLMDRTVVIGNTSNMPVSAREASIFSGITIAEYFRDQGYNVAIMADSTSRWAEALREISGRLEELPAEGGYPAYLSWKLASFYERGGYVEILGSEQGRTSSISIIGAVSPPGGDFSDPVVQSTKRFIKTFWALDAKLAYSRQYPAINWIDSYSLYNDVVKPWWDENIDIESSKDQMELMALLHEDDELQDLVKLIGVDSLPLQKQLIIFTGDLIKKSFLAQNAFDKVDQSCSPQKQAKMLRLVLTFHRMATTLLERGAPLFKLQEMTILSKIARVKTEVENTEPEKIDELIVQMKSEFDTIKKDIA